MKSKARYQQVWCLEMAPIRFQDDIHKEVI